LSPVTGRIVEVEAVDAAGSGRVRLACDYVFSSMPIKDLVRACGEVVPDDCRRIADGLVYRDFLTVGLLVDRMMLQDDRGDDVSDNWIYIQEPDVVLGRLQVFNNWSPYMVADAANVWLGLEYFCNDTDEIWKMPDERLIEFATAELSRIGIIDSGEVIDGTVLRMEKTYPAYFGTYGRFAEVREHVDRFENLYLIGRNGMHRYNNQDHSMLTAMMAVDNIIAGKADRTELWEVNAEMHYHEEKADSE
jgi:protoporphyrinogen oxidase